MKLAYFPFRVMSFSVLITGSSGYIASHFVKYFHSQGCKIYGIDREFPAKTLQKYLTNHIVEDISNQKAVSHFLHKHPVDIVIHCAAKCLVEESVREPELYRDYNVTRASSFLEICQQHQIKYFLFSSTAATYGEPIQSPIPESHVQQPTNPYGATKLEFERILLHAQATQNLHVGIVRYFNAAGADPKTEIGEHHDPESHLIPNLINALQTNQPIHIYGNDYPTKDGTCVRDYIHVWDLAIFHHLLAKHMIEQNKTGIFNLGSTYGYSILEVIQTAEKITGKKTDKIFLPRRPGDPSSLVADASKAKNELNWSAQYSSLESIIETAWNWHRDQ